VSEIADAFEIVGDRRATSPSRRRERRQLLELLVVDRMRATLAQDGANRDRARAGFGFDVAIGDDSLLYWASTPARPARAPHWCLAWRPSRFEPAADPRY
jgi:hypothetical protein